MGSVFHIASRGLENHYGKTLKDTRAPDRKENTGKAGMQRPYREMGQKNACFLSCSGLSELQECKDTGGRAELPKARYD